MGPSEFLVDPTEVVWLRNGFNVYIHDIPHLHVKMWYDSSKGSLGSLCWSIDAEGSNPIGEIPLHHIHDVFIGKTAMRIDKLLKDTPLAINNDIPSSVCLSLYSKKAHLHLQFQTSQERELFHKGIKTLFKNYGKKVLTDNKASNSSNSPQTFTTVEMYSNVLRELQLINSKLNGIEYYLTGKNSK